jgi:hypothetical protein
VADGGPEEDHRRGRSAFLIVRASESRQYGFLFKGSLLRGSYDTFHWAPTASTGPS